MLIKNSEFVTSISSFDAYLRVAADKKPEVVFLGKSNVGKSSFINMLCGRKNLARTSAAPGRTRLLNVFNINNGQFLIIDLPGYGYAEASKSQKEAFSSLIEKYLAESTSIAHAFALVDIRHEPGKADILMIDYLHKTQIPFTIIASKADKLSRAQANKALSVISSAFGVGIDDIIAVSNVTAAGKSEVLDRLGRAISYAGESDEYAGGETADD